MLGEAVITKETYLTLASLVLSTVILYLVGRYLAKKSPRRKPRQDGPDYGLRVNAKELILGTSDGQPLITFSVMKSRSFARGAVKVQPEQLGLDRFNLFAQALPDVLQAMNGRGDRWMRVLVNGPLANNGDGTLLPFVRDSHGQISSLARLQEPQLLSLAHAALFWQFASVVVVQKHLADISAQLIKIKAGIDRIYSFLRDQRKAWITGSLGYLDQAVQCIRKGELPSAVRGEMEGIERQLLSVQDHVIEDLLKWVNTIDQLTDEGIGSKKTCRKLEEHISGLITLCDEWALCTQTPILNWQVLSLFPGQQSWLETRREAIAQSAALVHGSEGLAHRIETTMRPRIERVDSIWNSEETLASRRRRLHASLNQANRRLEDSNAEFQIQLAAGEGSLRERLKPIAFAVRINAGKVAEILQITDGTSEHALPACTKSSTVIEIGGAPNTDSLS
jgi:hypothetical protein